MSSSFNLNSFDTTNSKTSLLCVCIASNASLLEAVEKSNLLCTSNLSNISSCLGILCSALKNDNKTLTVINNSYVLCSIRGSFLAILLQKIALFKSSCSSKTYSLAFVILDSLSEVHGFYQYKNQYYATATIKDKYHIYQVIDDKIILIGKCFKKEEKAQIIKAHVAEVNNDNLELKDPMSKYPTLF